MSESSHPERSDDRHEDGRPKLPDTMAIGTELWLVVIVAEIIAYIGQYPMFLDMMRQTVADTPNLPPEQAELMTSSSMIIGVMVFSGLVITAICLNFVWFARKGYNWARYALIGIGVFISVRLLFTMFPVLAGNLEGPLGSAWIMIPTVISGVAAIGATVMLMRRDSDRYCREMGEHRKRVKSGQQFSGGPGGPFPGGPTGFPPQQQWGPEGAPQQWPPQLPPQPQPPQPQRHEGDQSDGRS